MTAKGWRNSRAALQRTQWRSYPPTAVASAILATLIVATILSYVDRTVLSLLVPSIQHEFKVNDVQVSLLLGPTFAFFYAFMGVPLGWAADRTRRLRLAALGLALWSLMTVASGLSHTFGQLLLARVGVAIGEAVLLPTSVSLVTDAFPPEVRTRRLGLLGMSIYWGTGVALLSGGLLIGAVQHWVGAHPNLAVAPWRAVLILVGAPGVLVAGLLAALPEPGRRATAFAAVEEPILSATPRRSINVERPTSYRRIADYSGLFFAVGLMAVVGYSLSSWAPTHLIRAYGWSPGRAGASLGVGFLFATTLIIWLASTAADRLAQRGRLDAKYLTAGCSTLLALPAALICGLVRDPGVFVLCASVMMGCAAACIALGPAAVCEITTAARRGRAVGAYQTAVGLIGGGAGPPAIATLAKLAGGRADSLGQALSHVTAAGFIVAALIFWLRRNAFAQAVLRTQEADRRL